MEDSEITIFVIDPDDKQFIMNVSKSIDYFDLKKLKLDKPFMKYRPFHIIYRDIKYGDESGGKFDFEEGDRIYISPDRANERGVFANFHPNYNLSEDDLSTSKLTGILRLILIKYIATFIKDVNLIKSVEIREIINELKIGIQMKKNPEKDIQSNLEENSGNNIISYSEYVCSIIKEEKDIYNLLTLVSPKDKNEIIKYWSILSKYEEFNALFQKELIETLKKSYFDYSLIALSIYQQTKRKEYLKEMEACPNKVVKYLFHGTQIDPVTKIITGGFLYTKKAFYGMGVYFSDMLDYVGFYCGGTDFKTRRTYFGKVLPIDTVFSCVSAEVYYSKDKKIDIFDFSLKVPTLKEPPTYEEIQTTYKKQKVEKFGVHLAKVEPKHGQVRNKEDIIKEYQKGKFLGNEYVITEFCQILPLYGLTFKRNEFFVLWRDPHFKGENYYSKFLKERQLFINKYAKMNVYFESSTEKALEIIKRKKYNKIILISSIGLDLSGKKFVEVARKILGFDIVVLFFSANQNHFSWLKDFKNALYTSHADFYKEYILNYNEKGIRNLKNKIESYYKNLKLKLDDKFLEYPKFINQEEYDKIIFNEPTPYFKNVVIKNSQNILCMEEDGNISLKSAFQLNVNSYIWQVTILDDELTLFSNDRYLGVNIDEAKVTSEEFMKRFKFKKYNNSQYLIYYNDLDHVLTANWDKVIISRQKSDNEGQLFKLIEDTNFS